MFALSQWKTSWDDNASTLAWVDAHTNLPAAVYSSDDPTIVNAFQSLNGGLRIPYWDTVLSCLGFKSQFTSSFLQGELIIGPFKIIERLRVGFGLWFDQLGACQNPWSCFVTSNNNSLASVWDTAESIILYSTVRSPHTSSVNQGCSLYQSSWDQQLANRAGNTPVMFCKYIKEGGGIYLVTCHGYFDDGKIVHTCGGNQSAVGFALVTSRSAVGKSDSRFLPKPKWIPANTFLPVILKVEPTEKLSLV